MTAAENSMDDSQTHRLSNRRLTERGDMYDSLHMKFNNRKKRIYSEKSQDGVTIGDSVNEYKGVEGGLGVLVIICFSGYWFLGSVPLVKAHQSSCPQDLSSFLNVFFK